MRNAFAKAIAEVAAQDERVVLLSGDIGNRMFDRYKEMFAGRFYNCGVAEANMVSLAAGLALSGLRPYLYTITPFVTYRVYEQIRVDLCYHHQPVVIVGTGAGLSYASLGATHHSCEDIAVMRALPGMTVVCPGDPWEVAAATKAALGCDGSVFLRIGKKGEPTVHKELADFQIGKAIPVRAGRDVCLISTGNLLPVAVETAGALAEAGVSAGVVSMHTVKPLDQAKLEEVFFGPCRLVVTLEEHSLIGGLGGAVAEWLVDRQVERMGAVPGSLPGARAAICDRPLNTAASTLTLPSPSERERELSARALPGAGVEAKAPLTHVRGSSMSLLPGSLPGAGARLLRVGTMDQFFHEAGEQEHYRGLHGLTVPAITERVLRALGNGAAKPRLETTGVFGRTFSGGGVH